MNAQMDFCLALSLPRKLVRVMHLAVDQPGLRVTLEVRHDLDRYARDTIERRVHGAPCRFLQRLYDLRHALHEVYSSNNDKNDNHNNSNCSSANSSSSRKRKNESLHNGHGRPSRSSTPFLSTKTPHLNSTPSAINLARKLKMEK